MCHCSGLLRGIVLSFSAFSLAALLVWPGGVGAAVEIEQLVAADAAAGDNFGFSVDFSGERALVGAWRDDVAQSNAGSAYIFDRVAGQWTETAKLSIAGGSFEANFGVSVSLDGDRVLVGAPGQGGSGAAYVFERDPESGLWSLGATLTATDADPSVDSFGSSVSLSGDRAAIGAPGDEDPPGDSDGSIYIFERDAATGLWSQTAELFGPQGETVPGGTTGEIDLLGVSVSLEADRLVVGAPDVTIDDNDPGTFDIVTGAAFVFDFDAVAGGWQYTAMLINSDYHANDDFGFRLSLSGDRVLIGAPLQHNSAGDDQGFAYIFERSGGVWTQTGRFTGDDSAAFDNFGVAVSLLDGQALVGANGDDDNGSLSGSAYLFGLEASGAWAQIDKLQPPLPAASDLFGGAVALADRGALVGAPFYDNGATDTGSAFVFDTEIIFIDDFEG